MLRMSETIQLEQLLHEKAGVEEESHELDEEQKQLRLKAKVLAEKIIQELKKKNNAKQDQVNKLQSKVGELENQLNNLSVSGVLGNSVDESNGEEEAASETFDEAMEETAEDNVTVTEVNEEEMLVDDKQDKRKRKLF
jgi:hypothetical protein